MRIKWKKRTTESTIKHLNVLKKLKFDSRIRFYKMSCWYKRELKGFKGPSLERVSINLKDNTSHSILVHEVSNNLS